MKILDDKIQELEEHIKQELEDAEDRVFAEIYLGEIRGWVDFLNKVKEEVESYENTKRA